MELLEICSIEIKCTGVKLEVQSHTFLRDLFFLAVNVNVYEFNENM